MNAPTRKLLQRLLTVEEIDWTRETVSYARETNSDVALALQNAVTARYENGDSGLMPDRHLTIDWQEIARQVTPT